MDNPRKISLDLLDKVLTRRFNFDDAFERDDRIKALDQRDKNFIRNLCLTTFRHLGEIDHFIHKFSRNTNNILRLGVCQMKYLNMPTYAVADEMVDLAETKEHKGFINAVLRKCVDYKFEEQQNLNFPKWMLGSWRKNYGDKATDAFLPFMLMQPPVDITLKQDVNLSIGQELSNGSVRITDHVNITQLPGFEEGDWWVQDASSTFAVKMLGDIKGKTVLDMCAAPGGKTAQLCDAGAIVTAVDDSERRLERLHANMQRLGFKPEVICADAKTIKRQFDAVLLDAPCTATGTIWRNPDILHTRTQEDVNEMAKSQRALIEAAYSQLKPGGVLVYASCSLQYEEGEGQMKKLDSAKWKLLEEKRILPNMFAEFGGNGGFYCAKLQKI